MARLRGMFDREQVEPPPTLTRRDFDQLTRYIPLLQRIPAHEVNRGKPGPARPDGTHPWLTADYHPTVGEFMSVLEDSGFVDRELDWMAWQDKADKLLDSSRLLRCASLEMCINLLTVHFFRDYICVGYFGTMVGCGHIRSILLRLVELRDGAPERSDERRKPTRGRIGA